MKIENLKKCSQFIISLTSTKLLLCSSSSCSVSAVICKKKCIYLRPYMLAFWLICRYMIRDFHRQTQGGVDLVSAMLRWRRVKVQVSRRTKKMTCTVGLSFHQCTTSNWLLCYLLEKRLSLRLEWVDLVLHSTMTIATQTSLIEVIELLFICTAQSSSSDPFPKHSRYGLLYLALKFS